MEFPPTILLLFAPKLTYVTRGGGGTTTPLINHVLENQHEHDSRDKMEPHHLLNLRQGLCANASVERNKSFTVVVKAISFLRLTTWSVCFDMGSLTVKTVVGRIINGHKFHVEQVFAPLQEPVSEFVLGYQNKSFKVTEESYIPEAIRTATLEIVGKSK
ncbi:hypothetical protein Tco_0944391, partial [Tanacetum coccineum]